MPGKAPEGAILLGAIVAGNLNIILLLIAIANPVLPTGTLDAFGIWSYWIPRVVHDVASFWSAVYWVGAVFDAVSLARKSSI